MPSSDKLKIPLQEILSATNGFSKSNIIGEGGYGLVYQGQSKQHGMIATKRLNPVKGQGGHEYWMEVSLLSRYKHENLVSLIGFCDENGEKILVYKYEPNGSLDKALRKNDLSWMRRLEICVGAAHGLSYLHNGTGSGHGVIHRDIKSSNILLDENWNAKISDLGLSKIALTNSADSVVFTIPCGTRGYVDPQILNGGITQKSDVYSFGVVLYEVLFGKLVANHEFLSDYCFTVNIAKKHYKETTLHMMIDPDLRNEMDSKSLSTFSTIAYQCLKEHTDDRPTMRLVVEALEKALYYEQRSKLPCAMKGSLWAYFRTNEEPQSEFDALEIETLFRATIPKKDTFEGGRRNSEPGKVYLVDWRRANNTEIMLVNVKMPLPNMIAAALAMDESILDSDQIKNLIKFCPTKEEMELLKSYTGDKEMLGECEQFFLELMKVPRMESKLRVFLFKIQLNAQMPTLIRAGICDIDTNKLAVGLNGRKKDEVSKLNQGLKTVNSATTEAKESVLREIIKKSFYLWKAFNQGADRVGFKLDSLLEFADTRASNSEMTLMHYLCKVLASKSPELLDFHVDLVGLESASKIQLKYLANEMQAISKGLEMVEQELAASENDDRVSEVFRNISKVFLDSAELEVRHLISLYTEVGRNADALSLYFGEDPARYPFEQVIQTLYNFVRLFRNAHEENCKIG